MMLCESVPSSSSESPLSSAWHECLLTCSGAESSAQANGDLALSDIQTYDAVISRRYDDAGEDICAKYSWAHTHDGNAVSKGDRDQCSEEGDQSSIETVTQAKVAT